MYRQSEKNLLNSNASSTRPHNMVNFGPLTAEIRWQVWGTPAHFNVFHILPALLCGTSSGRQPNIVALNRGRHLYSAGWPSRWALPHILVLSILRHIHILKASNHRTSAFNSVHASAEYSAAL